MRTTITILSWMFTTAILAQDLVYTQVDQVPTYDNCTIPICLESDLNELIGIDCLKDNPSPFGSIWQSQVSVEFIVDKYGSTRDHKILDEINSSFSLHLLRAIRRLNKWAPAKVNHQSVSYKYRLNLDIQGSFGQTKIRIKSPIVNELATLD